MFHDGCTAGPLSEWLTGMVGICCDAHDLALDHSYDLWTFIDANVAFGQCVAQIAGWGLASIMLAAVCGPIGWLLYKFGPKRKPSPSSSINLTIHGSGKVDIDALVEQLSRSIAPGKGRDQ